MKLKTVFSIFAALLLMFLSFWMHMLISDYLNPQAEPVSVSLENSVFEDELLQIWAGEKIKPKFPEVPVMVWWTPFTGDVGVQDCGKYSCYVTNDRKFMKHPNLRNIFFYGTSVSETDLPLPRKGLDWSLLHEESPKNNQLFSHNEMMRLFNHTSTFRKESDFPLTTQYLESVESLIENVYLHSVDDKNRFMKEEDLAPVVYVQSGCDTPSNRDEWVKEFMKYVKVDSYGTCLNNKDLPPALVGSEQMEHGDFYSLLSKYKFMLSMENAVCPDYVTEKFWRSLQVGVVPIYLGAPNIEEWLPNPKSAIVIENYSSPEEVANLIKRLNQDDQAYLEYLEHKTKKKFENEALKDILRERSWGVSHEQQIKYGNHVKHFQCMVCNRVANNLKFTNIGFLPMKYIADESHYGCPKSVHPITKQVEINNWYFQEWFRTKYAAELLNNITETGRVINEKEFKQSVRDNWTVAFRNFIQGLNIS